MSPVKTPKRFTPPRLVFARNPPAFAKTVDRFVVGSTYYFLNDATGGVESAVCVESLLSTRGRPVGELSTDSARIRVDAGRAFRSFADCADAFGIRRGPGRPRVAQKRETPVRQLGRVSDAEFEEMQTAARVLGVTFSTFARETLLRRARDVIRRHNDANA